jgi:pyruvate/2-oxoglutarate dehydrogenase complex dihydrolipoamide dehydrogenase (E3) component
MKGDRVQAVVTDAGEWIGCDAVVLAIGVQVRTSLARSAGVKVRDDGTLHVDAGGRTNVPGVWACGDAVAVPSAVTGEPMHRPLAWDAFRTARVVGTNAARRGRGAPEKFEPSTGAAVVEVFGVEAAGVGLRREQAEAAGITVVEATITQHSRATYDPRSHRLHVRLLADAKSGRLVGGELAGRDGAAMRANVLVPLVKSGAHVAQLAGLDLVYTPSVAPMHDPLQVAARALVAKLGTRR